MNNEKLIRILPFIGVLVMMIPNWVNRYHPIPDFLHGLLTGIGLGLAIVGVWKMGRLKRMRK